jgi:hypothetical protein
MPNRWITFIKEWAKRRNISYNCALCDPLMRKEYYKKYPKKDAVFDKNANLGTLAKTLTQKYKYIMSDGKMQRIEIPNE